MKNRTVRTTGMNENSSRSHFLFFLNLEKTDKSTHETCRSSLCIADLAGSERSKRTYTEKEGLKEGNSIN